MAVRTQIVLEPKGCAGGSGEVTSRIGVDTRAGVYT